MNLEQLLLKTAKLQGKVRATAMAKKAGVSRTYVKRILQKLCQDGQLMLIGKANQARYILAGKIKSIATLPITTRQTLKNRHLNEDLVLREIEYSTAILVNLPKNIRNIIEYAFTEMLNNAIEHSRSKEIGVLINRQLRTIKFEVIDKGVGIFNNIRQKKHLTTVLDAIQDLLKGKQTTAPHQHSGEGIFFTSKVADVLVIQSFGKKLIFNNLINDVFIHDIKTIKGTKVIFSINLKSKKNLRQIFKNYSGKAYGFSKTKVAIKLYELGNDYISRSQARRVLAGLEKFKRIILDFRGVKSVGQSFADEVFRVWQNNHPKIIITHKNTNENINFMIKRAQNQ